jgi:hypothetical protein
VEPSPIPDGGSGGQGSTPSASGGSSNGAGGTPVVSGGCGTNVIDDFSTCDEDICETGGRVGGWYTFAGGSEEFTVPFATMIPRGDTLDANPAATLNLTLAKELQWTVQAPEDGFGMTLHRVELY